MLSLTALHSSSYSSSSSSSCCSSVCCRNKKYPMKLSRRRKSRVIKLQINPRGFLNKPVKDGGVVSDAPSVVYSSLKLIEWDQVALSVASFASTSFAKEATKAQLWCLNKTYEESLRLLEETNGAVEMHKYGCTMDFSGIDVKLVESGIQHARRGMHVSGNEAKALVELLQYAESLQLNLKTAIKDDADWFHRFMPLSEIIMELIISGSLVKFIQQLIDEDGSVKDSASSALKRSREQVRSLERKLYQLMEGLIRKETDETSYLEVSNVDGRWCLKSGADLRRNFEGLLLSSGSGAESIVEPLSAVPLNDELQQARADVSKAESDVLLKITERMQVELDDIEDLFKDSIRLDEINARATYSLSFGGTCPDLFFPDEKAIEDLAEDEATKESHPTQMKWKLYLPKAFHPLLLLRHRENLQKAMKDVSNAKAEIRRKKQQMGNSFQKEEAEMILSSLELQVTNVKQAIPVPVDIFIAKQTRVVVITGPNTGGKTICLKTVGLAAMMAKSGIYVLSSEPVKVPWFDNVFADIGDEQSLTQSLSTFSGHLKQTSEIRSHSTNRSLVLLDEVGAGTNPLEGAALGMSLLESFAESGALLTIATTHHGELKTLKYSNEAFENACMEFDDVKLKPTYRILWGVPGRSNAINIAERLGLPKTILDDARERYGPASAEINEAIVDMERFKQSFHEHIHESRHYLMLSRDLHEKLLAARSKVTEHAIHERYRKKQEISQEAAMARSTLHKKLRQLRATAAQASRSTSTSSSQQTSALSSQQNPTKNNEMPVATKVSDSMDSTMQLSTEKRVELPKVGDMVHISSLNKKARVSKVEPSKGVIVVQSGMMTLKLKLEDVVW